jgi:hypothetical protein
MQADQYAQLPAVPVRGEVPGLGRRGKLPATSPGSRSNDPTASSPTAGSSTTIRSGRATAAVATPSARAVLAIAPTPAAGVRLTQVRITAALRRAGRRRGIDTAAAELRQALRQPQLRQPLLVEQAMGVQALALLAALDTACDNVDRLAKAVVKAFQQHPDYDILVSFPGLSETGAARVLAEIGDDRARFSDARALKAYAGSAPVTRASGRSISITHRRIRLELHGNHEPPTGARSLRPTTRPRRPTPGRTATPVQPIPRAALPLPDHRDRLRPDKAFPVGD